MKNWIAALRLKTLPLALGAITMGSFINKGAFRLDIFLLACLTAILLQVLSNLANDYGDYQKGTDAHRADRQLTTGGITPSQMRNAVIITALLALISGLYLLYISFENDWLSWLVFFGIGLASIAAAITYTVGKKAYGYHGMGDLFVFLFFGLVGVLSTSYLFEPDISWLEVLPAVAYGCLCIGVLNVNNIRDIDKDVLTNKLTLAAKLGEFGAIRYQSILIFVSFISLVVYSYISNYITLAPATVMILAFIHLSKLRAAKNAVDYNAQLKLLSLGSLLVAILFTFTIV